MTINVGLIGFGRMGRFYLEEFQKNPLCNVRCICDVSERCRSLARELSPESIVTDDPQSIYNDPDIQLVTLCANADSRPDQIRQCLASGKHVIAEKPIASSVEEEWELVSLAESSPLFTSVNLYLRNSWYHHTLRDFIDSGEIGELAILRVCHMTPGLAPGEGHASEGPSFHDCGMHYVDLTRWYARSEYKTWHAQAVRMWDYKDPWWLQVHGTFENGVVYDITQGFVYGQLAKDQTHNSYIDIIGSKGIARMTHDFVTAHVDMRGETRTIQLDRPHGGKNIDRLVEEMVQSISSGRRHPDMPCFRDSAIASGQAYRMLADAVSREMPVKGTAEELVAIRERRRHMTNGYGLLPRNQETNQ